MFATSTKTRGKYALFAMLPVALGAAVISAVLIEVARGTIADVELAWGVDVRPFLTVGAGGVSVLILCFLSQRAFALLMSALLYVEVFVTCSTLLEVRSEAAPVIIARSRIEAALFAGVAIGLLVGCATIFISRVVRWLVVNVVDQDGRRCPRCAYWLADSSRCPECGAAPKEITRAAISSTHRNWFAFLTLILAAMPLIGLAVLFAVSRAHERFHVRFAQHAPIGLVGVDADPRVGIQCCLIPLEGELHLLVQLLDPDHVLERPRLALFVVEPLPGHTGSVPIYRPTNPRVSSRLSIKQSARVLRHGLPDGVLSALRAAAAETSAPAHDIVLDLSPFF